jgi:hypothetical protein
MKKTCLLPLLLCIAAASLSAAVKATVYMPSKANPKVTLAAHEVRRYFYLRTGVLPEISAWAGKGQVKDIVFFLCRPSDQLPVALIGEELAGKIRLLGKEEYLLKTVAGKGGTVHLIAGGDDAGLLYGAYAFAEQMGVRFYLHGDVIPDEKIKPDAVIVEEKAGKPLFSIRGIQPFHDFPEGPDWWTEDDYKGIFSQLVKLKMNFFGLHTYPEGGVGPEPLVWIGLKEDVGPDGKVKRAYPARHFSNGNGTWGYTARPTSSYAYKMGDLFDADYFGTSYMKGVNAWPSGEEAEIGMFNRTGAFFRDVFGYAKELGIHTCVGTETPLIVPKKVKEVLKSRGVDPEDSSAAELLYRGMFEWVKKNYPVDYYWFWTPEDWTWRENTPEELQKTRKDLGSAMRAARDANAPFGLATCGWVLGPANERSYFDKFLPKTWPMSCINRYVGYEPIEADFAKTKDRPLWAIPWMEDDPGLSAIQLWAGRMRRDAVDAAAYGCTGLIGIHWRTRILSLNVSALASSAWEQPWNPRLGVKATYEGALERKKTMNLDYPIGDFYRDWARSSFGAEMAGPIARIFERLDGGPVFVPNTAYKTHVPRPADWMDGPGGIAPDTLVWERRKDDYRFIDTLEMISDKIQGDGARERLTYWLDMFRYLRAAGKYACSQGEIQRLIGKAEKDTLGDRSGYWDPIVNLRRRQISELEEVYTWLIRTISSSSELGTVANWQQHIRDISLERTGKQVEKLFGKPLPAECSPGDKQLPVNKMVVPTVRTALRKGEGLTLKVLFYGEIPSSVVVKWRALGGSSYKTLEFKNTARNAFEVRIPSDQITSDFEYCIQAEGKEFRFPAGEMTQTIIVY